MRALARFAVVTTVGMALTFTLAGCPIIAGINNDYTTSPIDTLDGASVDGHSANDGSKGPDGETGRDGGHPKDGTADTRLPDGRVPDGHVGETSTGTDSGHPHDSMTGVDAKPDTFVACPSSCSIAETPGWTLVAFDADGSQTCPAGFTQTMVATPMGPGACKCSNCSTLTDPNCESGEVTTTVNGTNCSLTGPSYAGNDGTCGSGEIDSAGTSTFTAPPPEPGTGTCSAALTTTNPPVNTGVLCTSSTSCATSVCDPMFAASFKTCLYQGGDQTCPSGLTKHAVGASVTTVCSPCSCTVSASGCAGTMSIFSSSSCSGTPVFKASTGGSCETLTGVVSGDSYTYTANATGVTCTDGSSNNTDTVNSPGTICCGT